MINDTIASDHMVSALKTLEIEIGGLEDLKSAFKQTGLGDAFDQAVNAFASAKGGSLSPGSGKAATSPARLRQLSVRPVPPRSTCIREKPATAISARFRAMT